LWKPYEVFIATMCYSDAVMSRRSYDTRYRTHKDTKNGPVSKRKLVKSLKRVWIKEMEMSNDRKAKWGRWMSRFSFEKP
ncbi:hypothetical protein Tco_1349518, partial [Tanacetum coccineum]